MATPDPVEWDTVTMRNSSDGRSVVGRVFDLLGAFDAGAKELTLGELCAQSSLPRSTAHRLVAQLSDLGALERSARGWRLGTRMFELGQLVPREHGLRELAVAHMQDLHAATGETVQLAVADSEEVLYVEIVAGHLKVPTPSRRGGRMPMHCTALGKVLLAFSHDAGRAFLASRSTLERRTHNTIASADQLRAELHVVRHEHLAYDHEEAALGLQCVAAPILDRAGHAVAALSVSMPTDGRLTPANAGAALQTVASALRREGLRHGTLSLAASGRGRQAFLAEMPAARAVGE
jgi:IclR family acetate operon transcriptional repressor